MLQLVDSDDPDAHRVDERVVRIALLEVDLTADGRHPDAVAIAADAADDALEEVAAGRQRSEAEGVEDRHRPGAHRGDVPENSADARRRALVRLDPPGGGMRPAFETDHPT